MEKGFMEQYFIDLRTCDKLEHDRIMKIINTLAWDVCFVANNPKVYAFMWDRTESVTEISGIPKGLISRHPPHNT